MGGTVEDAERVRFVTRNFEQLQGLRYVPYALILVLLGVSSYLWIEPASGIFEFRPVGDLLPAGLIVLALVSHHYASVYYERRFGLVRRRFWHTNSRLANLSWIVIAVVFVLSFFGRWFGPVGSSLLAGAAIVAFILGDLWIERHRLTAYWSVLAVAVVGVCLLPAFGIFEGDAFALIAVPLGFILFLGLLLNHLLLARTLKPAPKEDGDAVG